MNPATCAEHNSTGHGQMQQFCQEPQAMQDCQASCGYCGQHVCMDHGDQNHCLQLAGEGNCESDLAKNMCPKTCGVCGDGLDLCTLDECNDEHLGLSAQERHCWNQALQNEPQARDDKWTGDQQECARQAGHLLETKKAAVVGNRLKKFQNTWSCQQITLGKSLGFVCASTDVICKGYHYQLEVHTCRRNVGSKRNPAWVLDTMSIGLDRPRVIAKQLKCGVAQVTDPNSTKWVALNGTIIPGGDGNKTADEREQIKQNATANDLGESSTLLSVQNVTYCNVTKVMGCRSQACANTTCSFDCEVELKHF